MDDTVVELTSCRLRSEPKGGHYVSGESGISIIALNYGLYVYMTMRLLVLFIHYWFAVELNGFY